MSAPGPGADARRNALKRAAAEAAVALIQDGMVVGLGTGSTAAFALEALARRRRQGLRFLGIPTSEGTTKAAQAAGIPLTSFAEHRQIDMTIDGADEVERGTLHLVKGLGGALLREKIVAASSHRLAIVVESAKLVDRLGTQTPIPVEVVTFGLQATRASLEALGASTRLRRSPAGEPFVTDGGNHILDCSFGPIADAARLERRIRRIVGVIECGLFISRADPVFVANEAGVRRLDSPRAHRGSPPILLIMGLSGAGKSTVALELAARLGWRFEEGDALHPEANIAKMHAGIPLSDADRAPWLARVAAWIDTRRAAGQPGIITCSALKRSYRQVVVGSRPEVRLVYLRGGRDLIAEHLAGRHGHFMPASLLQSQIDTLEEPDPDEDPFELRPDLGSRLPPPGARRGTAPTGRASAPRLLPSCAVPQCRLHRGPAPPPAAPAPALGLRPGRLPDGGERRQLPGLRGPASRRSGRRQPRLGRRPASAHRQNPDRH